MVAIIFRKPQRHPPNRKEKIKGNQYFVFYDLPIILAELSNIPNLIC